MPNYRHLSIQHGDYVVFVKFNRPSKGNALSIALMHEIVGFCEQLNNDTKTRVVVFTGEGVNFSTGMDLTDPATLSIQQQSLIQKMRSMEIGPKMIKAIYTIPQITIAAINGKALGGGACIASACDFRIGASDCTVGYPESRLGMNLSWLGLPLCVHLVGSAKAKRLVILGQKENSANLYDWGFLDEITQPDNLLNRAKDMAKQYSELPALQAQMIKRSINEIVSALDGAIMHMDKDQFILTQQSNR